jgi:hypothetical protein
MRTVRFIFDPGPKTVTADDVVRAVRTLLGAGGDLTEWQIRRMSLASPFTIDAECSTEIQQPYVSFVKKMAGIEKGKKPRGGLVGMHAKLLDSVDLVTKTAFGSVEIAPSGVKAVSINRSFIEQARQLTGQLLPSLMIHARQQVGQLRGHLEQITVRRDQRPRFAIRDRVSGDVIDCRIPDESSNLVSAAARAIGKRVTVTGLITYGDASRPTSIQAATIEPIGEAVIPFDKLPRLRLTEDGDAVGYVRRLRDA